MTDHLTYIGNELEVFRYAVNWKSYFARYFQPYLKGNVLEVGAGIGGTTQKLCSGKEDAWTCLEPDAEMADKIRQLVREKQLPANCHVESRFIQSLNQPEHFDAILYIDVIEHIEYDQSEVKDACQMLKPGGALIILVPAFQSLFSPFDAAIGHYRRYNKQTLAAAIPFGMNRKQLFYLDSVGCMASVVNKLFLKQSYPTVEQVKFWDTYLVSASKFIDPIVFHSFGKSLIGIWEKAK